MSYHILDVDEDKGVVCVGHEETMNIFFTEEVGKCLQPKIWSEQWKSINLIAQWLTGNFHILGIRNSYKGLKHGPLCRSNTHCIHVFIDDDDVCDSCGGRLIVGKGERKKCAK